MRWVKPEVLVGCLMVLLELRGRDCGPRPTSGKLVKTLHCRNCGADGVETNRCSYFREASYPRALRIVAHPLLHSTGLFVLLLDEEGPHG